jgi:hypothetical protein
MGASRSLQHPSKRGFSLRPAGVDADDGQVTIYPMLATAAAGLICLWLIATNWNT